MRAILKSLAVVAMLAASPVRAEETEHVLHEAIVGQGGLICDTVDEVKSFIGSQESRSEDIPSGCGSLQQPAVMRVVVVGVFETPRRKYLLVRYDFLSLPMPPQYGIGGVKDNGEPV